MWLSTYRTRIFLIKLGKVLPFFVCLIVAISYVESLCALISHDYLIYDNSIVLHKPISWFIAQYFEYNLVTIVILLTISVAIETCVWNKMAILYLTLQLVEKNYFDNVELYVETIYAIVLANIFVCALIIWKGINILVKKSK